MNAGAIITGAIGAGLGIAYVVKNKRKKKAIKSSKKKKANKPKKQKYKQQSGTPEKRLKDYENNRKQLNKYERIFFEELKKADPKGTITIKQRAPKKTKGGFIEYAYLIKYTNGERYLVTPKIVDTETLSYAIHEVCHQLIGHQDPNDKDFYLTPYKKELQVEDCVVRKFDKYQFPYKPRSKRSIRRAYQPLI